MGGVARVFDPSVSQPDLTAASHSGGVKYIPTQTELNQPRNTNPSAVWRSCSSCAGSALCLQLFEALHCLAALGLPLGKKNAFNMCGT